MRDDTHVPYAACTVCGEDFSEGVSEGYEVCTGCGCEEEYDGAPRNSLEAKIGDVCYLSQGHLGECEFVKREYVEPTPEEMAQVYRSLGVNPEESGTLL